MNTEAQLREQFENWYKAAYDSDGPKIQREIYGDYIDAHVCLCWHVWKAAHQSATEQMKPLVNLAKEYVANKSDPTEPVADNGMTVHDAYQEAFRLRLLDLGEAV